MDESIDMSDALAHASNPDDNIRSIGEGMLKRLHNLDLPNFLLRLSSELLREGSPEESRALAAITLKNSLDSKDPALKDAHEDLLSLKWLNLHPSIRSEIKTNLLMTLESDSRQSHSRRPSSKVIAKVIARVACMEIPRNQWLDLVGKLVDNMASSSSSLKQATLEVLEYIFEEKIPKVLKGNQVDDVMACVINALKNQVLSSEVHLAALKVLLNILELAKFKGHAWRNSIVAVCDVAVVTVCDVAGGRGESGAEIKEAAFECLVAMASTCHTKLEPYKEIMLSLTSQALEGDVESVKVQCIKLWMTICQEEINWEEEEEEEGGEEGEEEEEEEEGASSFIVTLCSFVPLLLRTYLKEEGDLKQEDIWKQEDEGDGDISMTAEQEEEGDGDISMTTEQEEEGDENVEQEEDETLQGISMTCLGLAARIMKGGIVPLVMHFVVENMNGPHKVAALSPLGFILEGPSVKQLAPVVDLLLTMMEDGEEGVRGKAAWSLGRLFELVGANRIMRNKVVTLDGIMRVLIEGSKDVPQVSTEVHGALCFLARSYGDDAKSKSNLSQLSPFVPPVIDALICASDLARDTPYRLLACPYKALSEIVRVSHVQDLQVCQALIGLMSHIMRRLNTVLHGHGAISSLKRKNQLEVLLCGLLNVLIHKLGSSNNFTLKWSAKCVLLLLCPLLTRDSTSARDGAALAIGALAHAIGGDFGQHMPMLLQYFSVKRLFPVYLEVMCDICQVLGKKGKKEEVVPSFDHIMDVLCQGMTEVTLQPPILSSIGQIALALGEKFEKYLPLVMEKLLVVEKLTQVKSEGKDEDHSTKVREGIFEAYYGIIGGITDPRSGFKVGLALLDFSEQERKRRDRDGRTLTAGVHALSQLPPRVEVWSEGFIRLMQEASICGRVQVTEGQQKASIYGRVQVTEGQQSGGLR
ncbi:importin subunit beta-1-like [Triticum urartu]|uniref:Importin N-terminal domain-containing protein n=1 Tax=Triticum urartu TaxID=4572 RepID=A0A8R7PJY8_TRIUA|nr:importin subunit beta-1-like [Triticum urartu]XP_048559302.1 importin subunit beta-1-like [Triticum urartu]